MSAPASDPLDPAETLGTGEAAQRLGVSADWLRNECHNKRVPHTRIAGHYRFTETQLRAILRKFAVEVQLPDSAPAESGNATHDTGSSTRKPRKSARKYPRVGEPSE